MPMLAGTIGVALIIVIALRLVPETKGKVLVVDIMLAVEA
jgi:hypothetical protein